MNVYRENEYNAYKSELDFIDSYKSQKSILSIGIILIGFGIAAEYVMKSVSILRTIYYDVQSGNSVKKEDVLKALGTMAGIFVGI